jgi:hypothetical protein
MYRALLVAAVAVACLAAGCAVPGASQPGASQPGASESGRLSDGGVTVVATLIVGPDGAGYVRATFSPQRPGYHLYSTDLPLGGVNGLGIPTTVTVRGALRATGSPTTNVRVSNLRIEELGVDLPVYPDGPVIVTVSVRRIGNGRAEVAVSYAACSAATCLPPVRNHLISLG